MPILQSLDKKKERGNNDSVMVKIVEISRLEKSHKILIGNILDT